MIEPQRWTGRSACALQAALRLTNEAFASDLGTAVRTVATWHQKPDRVPSAEIQQALDTVLERAGDGARNRFMANLTAAETASSSGPPDGAAYCLRVAVAVVVDGAKVLIVQRRGEDGAGISWQFPAGVIKPRTSAATVAVRETLAETGVHCAVVRELGSRLHPITNVYCDYLLCEYLTGEARNADVVENVGVAWAATGELTRFIPVQHIFPPVLKALEVTP
jgi:8-oxo-dGTP diphosphatase